MIEASKNATDIFSLNKLYKQLRKIYYLCGLLTGLSKNESRANDLNLLFYKQESAFFIKTSMLIFLLQKYTVYTPQLY